MGYRGRVDTSTRTVLLIGAAELALIVEKVGMKPRSVEIKKIEPESYRELLVALEDTTYVLIDVRDGFGPIAAYAAGYAAARGRMVVGIRDPKHANFPSAPESVLVEEFAYWAETAKELESVLKTLNEGGREMDNDGTWGGGGH